MSVPSFQHVSSSNMLLGCTFILVSNEWMHQRSTNTKLGLKIAPEEKVVYLLSFSRHEHAFQVTIPSRTNWA